MISKFKQSTEQKDMKNEKQWDWLPCVYDFKQEYDGKEIIWNFSPYVMVSSGDDEVSNRLQYLLEQSSQFESFC